MAMNAKAVLTIGLVSAALLVGVGISNAQRQKTLAKPLGDGPVVEFPSTEISQLAKQRFLDGDFTIIKAVKALPAPVLRVFTEQGGSRLLIANPGEKFLDTDFIYDSSIPRMRLIFAGVFKDRCFVHYEHGDYTQMYFLEFFRLASKDSMQPVWRGSCGPATDIQDLRRRC